MRSDIEVGARFPDYELPDHTGEQRKLSEIQGTNMMVLHLARGGYEPKEHRFLRQFADSYADFKVAYTRLAVITTDNQLDINEFRDAVGAEWPFLADPDRVVQRDLDIQEYTDPHDPMVPHTSCWSAAFGSSRSTTATGTGAVLRFTSSGLTCGRS